MVFGILGPELQKIFSWSNADYTGIVFWFEVAYAIGLTGFGRLLDWIGTRRGFFLSILGWGIAACMHALMSTVAGFSVARFFLGLSEAGVFPAGIKTTAEWFPKKERALVAGIFNAGCNVGAISAPLLVPWIFLTYGWQWTFILTGSLGFIWLVFWWTFYRTPEDHPRLSRAELEYIRSDPPDEETEKTPWLGLLTYRQAWAFCAAKFFTDSVWRWFLYLLPLFFSQIFKLDIKHFGLPFVTIYLMADFGSIGGGWISSRMITNGYSVNASRKTAMLICALCVVPVMFAVHVENMWIAVGLVGLAASAHQGFSSNLFTTVSDMFPKKAVASMVGLGGTAGAVGAMALLALTRRLFSGEATPGNSTQTYTILFSIASVAYLAALLIMHLLAPKLAPVRFEEK